MQEAKEVVAVEERKTRKLDLDGGVSFRREGHGTMVVIVKCGEDSARMNLERGKRDMKLLSHVVDPRKEKVIH